MRRLGFLFSLLLLFTTMPAMVRAEDAPITVLYDGLKMSFDTAPVLQNGTTLVQFRPLFEKMGLQISWEPYSKRITGTMDHVKIQLQIASPNAMINGQISKLDEPPVLIDGNTMVPLRFISEATGKRVIWDASTRTVSIAHGPEVVKDVPQLGDDSYDPLNYSSTLGLNKPAISEIDGIVYVLWNHTDTYVGGGQYTNFYVSMAKNGQWMRKKSTIRTYPKDITMQNLSLIHGNSIYWRDPTGVRKVTVSTDGTVTGDVYVLKSTVRTTLNNQPITEVLSYVDAADGGGILFGDRFGLTIYDEHDRVDPMIDVKDVNQILLHPTPDTKYVLNRKDGILNIFDHNTVRQLNIETGDLVYDANGQDKKTIIAPTYSANGTFLDGKMRYVYQDTDMRVKMVDIDERLNLSDVQTTNYFPKQFESFTIGEAESGIHMYSNVQYERRPSLHEIILTK